MAAKSFIKFIFVGLILFILSSSKLCTYAAGDQIRIPKIDQMPDFPQPYMMRDWNNVAKNFDELIFDAQKTGEYLPLFKIKNLQGNPNKKIIVLPSYVGSNHTEIETITCMGVLSSRLIAGLDKKYDDFFPNYFTESQKLYLNRLNDKSGNSFWYEIFPSVLFYRTFNFFPESKIMQEQFYLTADQWYKACLVLGGRTAPWQVPNFDYTAFDFSSMKPFDNGIWKEADAAAAIAWIEYMAYLKSTDVESKTKYLNATKWCMDYLQHTKQNPYYEILMPLGAYTAARMNAELGTNYPVEKFVNWCFDGSNWRNWGTTTGKWGNVDCAGLIGSLSEKANLYGFTMNTFDVGASLVPLVRYDQKFANAIGKWMLNAANSARLFYPNGLAPNQQTDYEWSNKNDPQSTIAYEGVRQCYQEIDRIIADLKTVNGNVIFGDYKKTIGTDRIYETIEGTNTGIFEHIWEVKLNKAEKHFLNFLGKTDGRNYQFSYSENITGEFIPLFDFNSVNDLNKSAEIQSQAGIIYIKVADIKNIKQSEKPAKIYIDDIWVKSFSDVSPYATGDAKNAGWAKTNLGIYGSAYVGIFGGIIRKTNVEGILQLDCLATDFYHSSAYPTYLYYNPFPKEQTIILDLGTEAKDIYESVSNKFISKDVKGSTSIDIAPKSAAVIVLCPSSSKIECKGDVKTIDSIIIDYK